MIYLPCVYLQRYVHSAAWFGLQYYFQRLLTVLLLGTLGISGRGAGPGKRPFF